MSCITKLLEMKGEKEYLPIHEEVVIEGGGSYKGYEYLITFVRFGHRCGYVAIPDWHRGDCDELNCHGGVTFSGQEHHAKDLLPIPCNDLWIGFDAAHGDDKPCYETSKKIFGDDGRYDVLEELQRELFTTFTDITHKTYEYMERECHYVIDQLVESQAA